MFIIFLKFSANRSSAGRYMDGHNAWLREGFEQGVFVLSGSIQPTAGGAVLAHNTTAEQIQAMVDADPFVAEDVVTAEIVEVAASKSIPALEFLVSR